jgi:hypothetical protein
MRLKSVKSFNLCQSVIQTICDFLDERRRYNKENETKN